VEGAEEECWRSEGVLLRWLARLENEWFWGQLEVVTRFEEMTPALRVSLVGHQHTELVL
jgi:hypothetical protein